MNKLLCVVLGHRWKYVDEKKDAKNVNGVTALKSGFQSNSNHSQVTYFTKTRFQALKTLSILTKKI